MSKFSDDEDLKEPAALRRERLIEEGRREVVKIAADGIYESLARVAMDAYRKGLDTMADICQPGVTTDEIGRPLRPVKVSPETRVLAINAVIRLLITARAEFAVGRRFDGNIVLPREEAVALSAVVEAAFGLDTEKLLESDLFDSRP